MLNNRNVNSLHHNKIVEQLIENHSNEYSCHNYNKKVNSKQKRFYNDKENYYVQQIKNLTKNRSNSKNEKDHMLASYQQYKATKGQTTQRSRNSASNHIKMFKNEPKQDFLTKNSIDSLLTKIYERLNRNEQQIQRLRQKNKNLVKRSEVKELLIVIKQQKEESEIINRENLTDIQKLKIKMQTIQMEIQKNIYSKIDFENRKLKDQFRKSTEENWQHLEEICSSVAQKNQSLRKEIEGNINKIKNWCQNQFTNLGEYKNQLFEVKTFRSNKFATKFLSFQYDEKITKVRYSPRKHHLRSQKKHSLGKNINRQNQDKQNQSPQFLQRIKQKKDKKHIFSKIYYIDYEGYLLDNDLCYLVNEQDKQIKLINSDIVMLKQLGILQESKTVFD